MEDQKRGDVIAASAGNHAPGVAVAARKLGLRSLIVMPTTAPQIKRKAVKAMGAEEEKATLFLDRLGYRFLEASSDPAYRLFL